MKKLTAILCLLGLLVCFAARSQQTTLKGNVSDTATKQNLEHALITILRVKDSTLYKFTRADAQGNYSFSNLVPGAFKVVITYPGYADYVEDITVSGQPAIEMGHIGLITKAHLLEDVVVRQQIAAIRLKGDTIEYKADSFKVRPGASVEEMLKKVPGFQIDKDGKITVQGEKIEKVLLDGEEFFGDDPTVATRNLDAAAIDKFQVYDKKSDQATFTGIDDGSKTKTLNLKMKEDRKKGVFGKLEAGAGPDDKWNNSLMANAFKGKRRLSFYGIMSSTGKTGLGWDESSKYGDNNLTAFTMDDGGTAFGISNYDDFGNTYGQGIPKSWSAGINYGNKFDQDRKNLNGSYKYGKIITDGTGTTVSQSILPDTLFFNNQTSTTHTERYRNTLSGTYDWAFDSSFSAKLTLRAYKGNSKTYSVFSSEALNASSNPVNRSNRTTSAVADDQLLNTSLLLRKKFRKPGRTLSLNIDQRYTETNTDGFIYSLNNYYDKQSVIFESDTTNQEKKNGSLNKSITGKLAYTEALTSALTLELSYGLGKTNTASQLLSYNKDITGKYSILDKTYSNDYAYDVMSNAAGAVLRYNSKKYLIFGGGDIARTDFTQRDQIKDSTVRYGYNNFFPRAGLTYKFNSNRRLSFNYNGNTRQPTIQQLQPVSDNTNPLNIQVGNPNLKQEFTHTLYANYNDYKVLKQRGINMSASFGTTSNAIRSSIVTDSIGRTKTQYLNANGNYNYRARFGYSQKFPKLWDINFNTSYSFYESVSSSYVNGLLNESHSGNHSIGIGFSKFKENVYDLYTGNSFSYNTSYSSIRPDVNNNYWSINSYLGLNIQLPGKLEISQSVSATFREKTDVFKTNNNVITWDAYIAKKIFKDKKSEIRLSAFDLLDQNKGVSRNTGSTTVTEVTTQTLHRYFLVSFIWNFLKNPPTANGGTASTTVISK
jgi:hypothetical protein